MLRSCTRRVNRMDRFLATGTPRQPVISGVAGGPSSNGRRHKPCTFACAATDFSGLPCMGAISGVRRFDLMKGLLAWIVGVTLIVSWFGAPRVIADENGEIHYWSSSTSYVPQDEGTTTYVSDEHPVQYVDVSDDAMVPGDFTSTMPAAHGHVYIVNDDPGYDLTGPSDHWFLMGDGTAFRDENWHSSAAFASTAQVTGHEVVPITAEFRQDWLAVAAGDRPVRTFTAPRSVSGAGVMAVVPMENSVNEP